MWRTQYTSYEAFKRCNWLFPDIRLRDLQIALQIGFLTEWQMYAQKIEGDSWKGEKLDKRKVDKMSGKHPQGC